MHAISMSHSTTSGQPPRPYSYPVPRPWPPTSSKASTSQKKIRLKVEAAKLPKSQGKPKKR